MITTADKLRAEGAARGRASVRAEAERRGRVSLLTEQLAQRFGALNDQQRQTVIDGSTEQITTWSARLIIGGATTIDDVLR